MNNKAFLSPKHLMSHFLKPYKAVFVTLFVVIPFSVIAGELIPWYIAKIINLISSNNAPAEVFNNLMPEFYKLAALTIATTLIGSAIFLVLQYKCLAPAGIAVSKELFEKMQKKDCRFWNTHTAGNIWGKIDLTRRTLAAYSSLGSFFYDGYGVFCSMVIMIFLLSRISYEIACCFILSGFVILAFYTHISNNVKKISVQSAKYETAMFGKVVNMLLNFLILKTFGTERQEQKKLENDLSRLVKSKQKKSLVELKNIFMQEMLVLFFYVGVTLYAVYLWTERKILVGDIVYVMVTATAFCSCISTISGFISFIKSRIAILNDNIKIFNSGKETSDIKTAKKLKITQATIEFKNLSFSYPSGKEVLSHINFVIKPKEKIGIVGMSGSGKTTLVHLLLKLLDTPQNTIFIDNQDITAVTQKSLCETIGFIPQDTSLFHRSILENIQYGKINATGKAVKKAAQTAYADEWIETLPQKYKTLVGDLGVKLSGGQRQRIAIARAVLKDAPILILDEATSALDSESETYIEKAIEEIIKNKTVIAIAHRLSTLKNMDRIIVLEKGKIIEQGTPKELLKLKGKFFKLWKMQEGKVWLNTGQK
ncbi:MAG: ABC transporter ATP-binding protein [Alphaproteobacteria bacterium]|nr:ABC transporter ATP-binding protein [Alphaproteobacteria bacterium]